jgi:hypothetical protein
MTGMAWRGLPLQGSRLDYSDRRVTGNGKPPRRATSQVVEELQIDMALKNDKNDV